MIQDTQEVVAEDGEEQLDARLNELLHRMRDQYQEAQPVS